MRKSTGQRQNRCVQVRKYLINSKRAEQGKQSLLGSLFVYIGVLSNDFADVDVREELCYHSRPEKSKIRKRIFLFDFTLFFIVKVCLPSL